jgi:hypothetical protein
MHGVKPCKDAPWRVSTENITRTNLSYPSSIDCTPTYVLHLP